jgi:hypothetical protein
MFYNILTPRGKQKRRLKDYNAFFYIYHNVAGGCQVFFYGMLKKRICVWYITLHRSLILGLMDATPKKPFTNK